MAHSIALGSSVQPSKEESVSTLTEVGDSSALPGMSSMMAIESSVLSEPWFDQLKNEGDAFLIEAGKISVVVNP